MGRLYKFFLGVTVLSGVITGTSLSLVSMRLNSAAKYEIEKIKQYDSGVFYTKEESSKNIRNLYK